MDEYVEGTSMNHNLEMLVKNTLTKREKFAMAAMQGFCAATDFESMATYEHMATMSIKQADELIKQLSEEKK